jgi:hypothetical protein
MESSPPPIQVINDRNRLWGGATMGLERLGRR